MSEARQDSRGLASGDGGVRNGGVRHPDFEAELFDEQVRGLFTDQEGRRIGVGAQVVLMVTVLISISECLFGNINIPGRWTSRRT